MIFAVPELGENLPIDLLGT